METRSRHVRRWTSSLSLFIVLCADWRCSRGLSITSKGPQTLRVAAGDTAVLGCSYETSAFDSGALDIEWSMVSPDTTQKDKMLLSHTSGSTYDHGVGEDFSFVSRDPSLGDASLSVGRLSLARTGTYQCKVKKSPGVDSRKISLLVMKKPSVPKCWLEGSEMEGEPVALRCESAGGATPLTYSWRRVPPAAVPPAASQSPDGGELKIRNLSLSFAGRYLCEANNAVGAEGCGINLRVERPPTAAAVVVGTVVGSILLSFILLVFVALLYWKLRVARRREKDFSNEIREDVPPPQSRPVSRHTSHSGERRPQVIYCPVGGSETQNDHKDGASSLRSNGYVPISSTPMPYVSSREYGV